MAKKTTKIAMAHQGTQYSRAGISISWPYGGEREVLQVPLPLPRDVQRAIVAQHIAEVTLPATKFPPEAPKQRLLTGEEARAHKAEPAGPVTRIKVIDGQAVEVPVLHISPNHAIESDDISVPAEDLESDVEDEDADEGIHSEADEE